MIFNKGIFLAAVLAVGFQLTLAAPLELVAVDRSETSITISWHYDQSKYGVPKHYELAVDDTDLEFLPTTEKVYVLRSISPCHSYNLTLSAVFSTTTLVSDSKTISTLSQAPKEVKNLRTDKGNLFWDTPSNSECVKSYKVCAQAMAPHAKPVCKSVPKSPESLAEYEGCSSVMFQVSGEAEDKKSGNPVWLAVETPFKEPLNPTNLNITSKDNTAELDWDIPRHYSCVEAIDISYGPKSQPKKTIIIGNPVLQKHQNVMVYNLTACSDYEFTISHTSTKGKRAVPVKGTMSSQDLKPEALKGLAAASDPKEKGVKITWSPLSQSSCAGGVNVCLINDLSKNKTCKDQKDPTSSTLTFEDVNACEKYTIVAKAFSSHSKMEGPTSSIKFESPEQAPGPVSNLKISEELETSLKITFDEPKINSRCVVGYSVISVEVPETLAVSQELQSQETVLNNLKTCTDYKISVAAVTASQKAGPAQSVNGSTTGNPTPVTDLKPASRGYNYIELSWDATQSRKCAENYWVEYTSYRSHHPHTVSFKNERKAAVVERIANLDRCVYYSFKVWAESHGTKSEVVETNAKTLC